MNKQEKIFSFIVDLAQEFGLGWNESVYLADHILTYQDKMGVVIGVEVHKQDETVWEYQPLVKENDD